MEKPTNYSKLPTEKPNPSSRKIDLLSNIDLLKLINEEDRRVPLAVRKAIPDISKGIYLMVESIKKDGCIFFIGAGTSGRLGIIEAAECPPTFNTPPSMIRAIIAGGKGAVFRSREGAEDCHLSAKNHIRKSVRKNDVVIGIAASGITPFVKSALEHASKIGARTMLITCNDMPYLKKYADVIITASVGPEIITGSTRLKAGTATKLILNMLTVGTMVRLGKVYGNLMIDVRPTSNKLKDRALRIIQQLTGVSAKKAQDLLRMSHNEVATAIAMHKRGLDYKSARPLLDRNHSILRKIIG